MIRAALAFICISFFWGCQSNHQMGQPHQIISIDGTTIPVFSFEAFSPVLKNRNDTTYVVNFWATWCGPCVKEIPHFVEVETQNSDGPMRWIYVTLDEVETDSLVVRVANKLGIADRTVLLDETDFNAWLNRVDPNWSGAIPATIVYNSSYRRFKEGAIDKATLEELLEEATSSL